MSSHAVLALSAFLLLASAVDLTAQDGRISGAQRSAPPRSAPAQLAGKASVDPALIAAAARTAKVSPRAISDADPEGRKLAVISARAISPTLRSLAAGRYVGTLDTQVQGPKTKLPAGKYNLFITRHADRWHLYFESGGRIVGEAAEVNVRSIDPKNTTVRSRDSVNVETGAVTLRTERPLSKRGKPLLSSQEAIRSVELRGDTAAAAIAAVEASLESLIGEVGRLLKADAGKDLDAMSARLRELQEQKKRIADALKKQVDAQSAYERFKSRLRGVIRKPDAEELKRLAADVEAAAAQVGNAISAFKAAISKAHAEAKRVVSEASREAAAKAEQAARAAAESVKNASDKVTASVQKALDAATQAAEEVAETAAQAADDAAEAGQNTAEAGTDTATDVVEAIISFFI